MSNHLVFKSFFVGQTRWPWKFVYDTSDDSWTGYSATDNGHGDGIRRAWDFQCEYSSYDGLKDCIAYAQETANTAAMSILEQKAGGQ